MSINNLSVVILTKNEEASVVKTIKSVKGIADEIITVDDGSIDQTRELARTLGARVYQRTLDNFSSQRNYGLKKAKGDWVLFLDADEIVSPKLRLEIKSFLAKTNYVGFYITRKDFFLGRVLNFGEAGNIKLLRLAKNGMGKWHRKVHETWRIRGQVGVLRNHLYHYSHKNIAEFVESVNEFSSLHAKENVREGKKSSIFKIVFWPLGKFFYNYLLKLGFLDGTRGFIYAVLMSFHSYLAWSKQWTREER